MGAQDGSKLAKLAIANSYPQTKISEILPSNLTLIRHRLGSVPTIILIATLSLTLLGKSDLALS